MNVAVRKSKMQTLYVHRPLLNAKEVIAWAKENNFKTTLLPDDMHVTVAYSKTPIDWDSLDVDNDPVAVVANLTKYRIKRFDQGAVVLAFTSAELKRRWQELKDVGASWSYPDYIPHVTLTYEGDGVDLAKIESFTGDLMFGPEVHAKITPYGQPDEKGSSVNVQTRFSDKLEWVEHHGRLVLRKAAIDPRTKSVTIFKNAIRAIYPNDYEARLAGTIEAARARALGDSNVENEQFTVGYSESVDIDSSTSYVSATVDAADEEEMRPVREKERADALVKSERKETTLKFFEDLRRSTDDEDLFMEECVSALEDEGYADPEYACQIMWDNGDDISDVLDRSFDEGQHPRDENGRWTDGSGSDNSSDEDIAKSKSPASDLLARNHKNEPSLEEVKAKLPPEFKAEEKKAQDEMKGRMITQKEFMDENGKYVPERAAIHRAIIRELFTDTKIKHATPPIGTKPVLTLSGGRPAAGKTTSLKRELAQKIKTSFYINADEIQEKLPGYKGRLAGLYNAEAQDVALQAEKVARHMGLNIIYDATLKSKQPALERVLNYKEAGYDVDGYFVHTTPATSVARSADRFLHDPDGLGRYLPPEISFNSRTNESTFDALIPHLSKWALYDNNGAHPKRIAGNNI